MIKEYPINLYHSIGEALYYVQILEDALSHALVLKKTEPNQKEMALEMIKKQQYYTFGKAIKTAKKERLFAETILERLSEFLPLRNWLIHECIIENKSDLTNQEWIQTLIRKIKTIISYANDLRITIELDLIEYSQKKGAKMEIIKSKMNKYYGLNL